MTLERTSQGILYGDVSCDYDGVWSSRAGGPLAQKCPLVAWLDRGRQHHCSAEPGFEVNDPQSAPGRRVVPACTSTMFYVHRVRLPFVGSGRVELHERPFTSTEKSSPPLSVEGDNSAASHEGDAALKMSDMPSTTHELSDMPSTTPEQPDPAPASTILHFLCPAPDKRR